MSVIRINKTKDYTTMCNYHFKEKEMSLKAKGLLSLMLSLPDDWDYSIAGLIKLSKDGRDSVMGALNELEQFGYLKRSQCINEKGQFAGYNYDVFEKTFSEKPYSENPISENQLQLSTKEQSTKEQSTNNVYNVVSNTYTSFLKEDVKDVYNTSSTKKSTYGVYKRIKLTNEEYSRLCTDYGKDFIDNQIDLLDEYVESNNNKNKYTNFNLVLRKSIRENWFQRNNNRNGGYLENGMFKTIDGCIADLSIYDR